MFISAPHVAQVAAEAAMDTTPWNYWEADGKTPVGRSGEAVRLLGHHGAKHAGTADEPPGAIGGARKPCIGGTRAGSAIRPRR